jgi:N-acetylmuramoyl-L-alanine amidase
MAAYHTVEQGEHLPLIAHKYTFANYLTIWDHPNNADLKEKRRNPNVLLPGDQVFIPDKEPKTESVVTEQLHRFKVRFPKVMLRLILKTPEGETVRNTECELSVEGETFKLTTDGDGLIEQKIPATAEHGILKIKDESSLFDSEIPIKIGHLDPIEEKTGQIARLNNLNYFAGPIDDIDQKQFRSAVEEFQCDHGLKVDGICGPTTQAKLKEVHGC